MSGEADADADGGDEADEAKLTRRPARSDGVTGVSRDFFVTRSTEVTVAPLELRHPFDN
eukprot:gene6098-2695_t